ncbi:protein PHLOEM PROTEIN 2-LIKE A9 [Henckelia pumila]|uniref:protein PHLOEM PROTEIN 2-LIKE A9 n=1 Tax=Henckelia pumila TaxID=405737 RepID=UPI003C6E470F
MSSNNPHHIANFQLKYKETPGAGKMVIQPQYLNIVWGRDDRYWNVREGSMPAELYQVCWLEVTGCVDETNPKKDYEVGFEVSLAPDAFGWGASPLYLMIKRGKEGKFAWTKFQVNPDENQKFKIFGKLLRTNQSSSGDDKKLYFGLYEVWSEKWKGGLRIHNAYVQELN